MTKANEVGFFFMGTLALILWTALIHLSAVEVIATEFSEGSIVGFCIYSLVFIVGFYIWITYVASKVIK